LVRESTADFPPTTLGTITKAMRVNSAAVTVCTQTAGTLALLTCDIAFGSWTAERDRRAILRYLPASAASTTADGRLVLAWMTMTPHRSQWLAPHARQSCNASAIT
jgi:hypothetical protein